MKKQPLNILLLVILTLLQSCSGNGSSSDIGSYEATLEPVYVAEKPKPKFDGSFNGYANGEQYQLDIANSDGIVSGTMKDGQNNFLLSGTASGDKITGTMKYILGDLPFEAYYQGPSLVVQLDKETMDALKVVIALASENADALLADTKIVFDER